MSSSGPSTEVPQAYPDAPLRGIAAHVNHTGLLAIIWTCYSVASLFVTLRLTVRWRQNGRLLFDDYWMVWAWLCVTTMAILQTVQTSSLWFFTYLTSGRIAANDPQVFPQMSQMLRFQFPVIKLFWTVLWSVKASFLAAFYPLVKPTKWIRICWFIVVAFTTIAYIGCWLASTLTCTNPGDYFIPGNCDEPFEKWMSRFNIIYSTSVDIASDVMIMALPIAVLPSLQLNRKKKIGLGIAFSIGFIIIAVALVRMSQILIGQTVDMIGLAIWGAIETMTAVIVGSLLPLKALLTRNIRNYTGKKSSQRSGLSHKYGGDGSVSRGPDGLVPNRSRSVMVAESIPLDDIHKSNQKDGQIYVQKTYGMQVEQGRLSDDEIAIVGRAK
ncbi:unnamed protein product [Clonostachys rhizophaga]|uniref:Rhodopsin domain-containing protein n=1 Tax=Clonostachys rhizophaga TaxID=160324 RepID=A0A9N9W0J8_9HYPO|nr:unnamed protein product [Clonostachys rhizophaga]